MPVRAVHDIEDAFDVVSRDLFMEEIAHRVDEDALRGLPVKRQFQHLRLQRELKSIPVVGLSHRLQALRKTLGIAMLAAGAYLGASGDRIPGRVCPFDV